MHFTNPLLFVAAAAAATHCPNSQPSTYTVAGTHYYLQLTPSSCSASASPWDLSPSQSDALTADFHRKFTLASPSDAAVDGCIYSAGANGGAAWRSTVQMTLNFAGAAWKVADVSADDARRIASDFEVYRKIIGWDGRSAGVSDFRVELWWKTATDEEVAAWMSFEGQWDTGRRKMGQGPCARVGG